ncbi:unnamed protein product [Polarella glacialis]|uniref:Actin-binding transcription modulator n=1 Tax=Polarella glacialis TaxID=89957 RepID=A0A813EBQ0_POLGL|nr:unnamed protein product [Polarella glacialis]
MSENEAYGKRAKGGANVGPKTVLADLVLADGSEVALCAAVEAKLVELNDQLSQDPGLLLRAPEDEGFLAILQPRRPQVCKVLVNHNLAGILSSPKNAQTS